MDRYQYTYDDDSNVTTKTNTLNSALDETYTYNSLNQFTAVTRNGTPYQSWVLDALGNMLSITTNGTTQTRTYNDQNQLLTEDTTDLAYDKLKRFTEKRLLYR